jgi:hypothetical protein
MPAFRWREEDPGVVIAGVLSGLLQLVLPAAALTALGVWRLRRYAVV